MTSVFKDIFIIATEEYTKKKPTGPEKLLTLQKPVRIKKNK